MNNKTKLELTWIGKDNRPKLEPRILLEDPEKSYHAPHKVTDKDLFDNRLIFGDNLLALKALEQRRVRWPMATVVRNQESEFRMGVGTGDWEVLTAEMRRYEYDIGPTGQISYAAPSGYHDDCVMALALGVWGCRTFGVEPGRMLRLGVGGQRTEIGRRRTVTLA